MHRLSAEIPESMWTDNGSESLGTNFFFTVALLCIPCPTTQLTLTAVIPESIEDG